jgi:hypothetical protein
VNAWGTATQISARALQALAAVECEELAHDPPADSIPVCERPVVRVEDERLLGSTPEHKYEILEPRVSVGQLGNHVCKHTPLDRAQVRVLEVGREEGCVLPAV